MATQLMDQKTDAYKIGLGQFSESVPRIVEAYHNFTGECFADGALSAKDKQLIALGVAVACNNEVCTFYHVNEALSKGATPDQVTEALAAAAAASAGHIMSQGVTRVQRALGGQVQ